MASEQIHHLALLVAVGAVDRLDSLANRRSNQRICRALSRGAESPRQGKHPTVSHSRFEPKSASQTDLVASTARRIAQILWPRSMSILTIRGCTESRLHGLASGL
jgi:hypothetical protein